MRSRFRWTTFDLNGYLPAGWQQDVRAVANDADFRDFPRTPILSREGTDVESISRGRVHANQVRERLPWLYSSYRKEFLELAAESCAEPVKAAVDDRYGVSSTCNAGRRCGSSATSTPTR